jgi:uncharacterized protein with ATP-grasp and redox domains
MDIYINCIPCFARQSVEAAIMATRDPRLRELIIRKALKKASEIPFDKTPAHMGMEIHRIIRNLIGDIDPYSSLKSLYNKKALDLYPYMKMCVEKSKDRIETAVRIAIAGNIIDFGISPTDNELKLKTIIDQTMTKPFSINDLGMLKASIERAQRILYIADNAGEVVFDRIFIEEIPDYRNRVTFAVKGHPVINDATMKDADETGITDTIRVIDNGSDAPGTILETCKESFQREFSESDLIISKGQGNYESLSDCGKTCCFLLKAKCPIIAGHFSVGVGDIIVKFMK